MTKVTLIMVAASTKSAGGRDARANVGITPDRREKLRPSPTPARPGRYAAFTSDTSLVSDALASPNSMLVAGA
jgi:hypothetical protein